VNASRPDEVRATLAALDDRERKIALGLTALFMRQPEHAQDREWVSRELVQVTLFAGEFEASSPDQGVAEVQAYLEARAEPLLRAAFLLFERVGLDLAPRAAEGFTFEEAMAHAVAYLPRVAGAAAAEREA